MRIVWMIVLIVPPVICIPISVVRILIPHVTITISEVIAPFPIQPIVMWTLPSISI
jgi:hypothetical protein